MPQREEQNSSCLLIHPHTQTVQGTWCHVDLPVFLLDLIGHKPKNSLKSVLKKKVEQEEIKSFLLHVDGIKGVVFSFAFLHV